MVAGNVARGHSRLARPAAPLTCARDPATAPSCTPRLGPTGAGRGAGHLGARQEPFLAVGALGGQHVSKEHAPAAPLPGVCGLPHAARRRQWRCDSWVP